MGAAVSSSAVLTIIPVVIFDQPQSKDVLLHANAGFSVNAISEWSSSYQWQFNGLNLPGKTDSSLAIMKRCTRQRGAAIR